MQPFNVRPHSSETVYGQPHFFLQSKGYNAGRPSATPYTNSYVVTVSDEIEKGMLFWVSFGLWKSNRFIPLLEGKVPMVLNPDRAATLMNEACEKLYSQPGKFLFNVKELRELIQTEQLLSAQLKVIHLTKNALAKRMFR